MIWSPSPACWFGPVQTLSSYTVWASGPGANLICFSTHTKSVREIAPDCISMTLHGEMWASVSDTSVERVASLLHNWWPTRALRVRAPCRDEVSRSLNELELDTWLRAKAHNVLCLLRVQLIECSYCCVAFWPGKVATLFCVNVCHLVVFLKTVYLKILYNVPTFIYLKLKPFWNL